jgi:hypothetical protein
MLCLTLESSDQYDSSSLSGYQFVNKGILFLLTLLCSFHHNQSLSFCGDLFVINFIILVSYRFKIDLLDINHLLIWERTVFDIVQKSSKFLLEIFTLVSSANKMSSVKVFIIAGRSFIYIMKSKGPQIDFWELHVSLFPILRKISQIILFQFFFSICQTESEPVSYCSLNAIIM